MKLLYIEWNDAVHNANWFSVPLSKEWHKTTNWTIKESGWLVKEDKKGLTLASRYKPADENTEAQFGGLQFIPKPWIVKRKTLLRAPK